MDKIPLILLLFVGVFWFSFFGDYMIQTLRAHEKRLTPGRDNYRPVLHFHCLQNRKWEYWRKWSGVREERSTQSCSENYAIRFPFEGVDSGSINQTAKKAGLLTEFSRCNSTGFTRFDSFTDNFSTYHWWKSVNFNKKMYEICLLLVFIKYCFISFCRFHSASCPTSNFQMVTVFRTFKL